MKKIIYIFMMVVGLIGFISLNVIVCLLNEDIFPFLKHLVMIIGYISMIIFGVGFLFLIKCKQENIEKNNK